MESQEEMFKNYYDAFQKSGGKLQVLENCIPVEQQIEYLIYSYALRRRRRKKMKESDYNQCMEKLENVELSKEEKKKILSMLAFSSEIRAYRLLEQYVQHPDKDLVHWASMALLESRMAIETELSGERQIYISSGLGGKGDKMRFYVLVMSSKGKPFEAYQLKVIEKEFGYLLPEYGCEIERLNVNDNYVEIVLLIPMVNDVKKALEKVVLECNVYGNFLSQTVIITNVKELNQNEINQALKKNKKS